MDTTSSRPAVPAWDVTYNQNGSGRPVLFLHGLGLDKHQWNDELDAIPRPAAALSLPGQGETPALNTQLTIPNMAAAVIQWLEDHDWHPVDLVGCSMGGLIAWEMYSQAPERVHSILTFGSAPRLLYPLWIVRPAAWILDWWYAGKNPRQYAQIAAKGASRQPATRERLKEAFTQATQWRQSIYDLRCAMARYDYLPTLSGATIPIGLLGFCRY